MSKTMLDDQLVRILAPIHLKRLQQDLLNDAQQRHAQGALRAAWPSLRQANWFAEVAAQAENIPKIQEHLREQGQKRWSDHQSATRLYQVIGEKIGDRLHRHIEDALLAAGRDTVRVLKGSAVDYSPSADWLAQEQLALARLYIHSLVAWRRIDQADETR